jgi:hypothetical protein
LHVEGEENLTIAPCRPPEPAGPGAQALVPTTEDLAGHYILVEGVEDLTLRPRQGIPLGNGCAPADVRENTA